MPVAGAVHCIKSGQSVPPARSQAGHVPGVRLLGYQRRELGRCHTIKDPALLIRVFMVDVMPSKHAYWRIARWCRRDKRGFHHHTMPRPERQFIVIIMNYRRVGAVVRCTDRVFSWRFRVRQNDTLARRGCPFVIWLTKIML